MCKCLLNGDARFRVVREHALDQVYGLRVGSLEKLIEVLPFALGKTHHELFVLGVLDLVNQLLVGITKQIVDLLHLFVLVLRGKKSLAGEEFSENAAD